MNRKDSGFVESYRAKGPNKESIPGHGSDTSSTCCRKLGRTPTASISSGQPRGMEPQSPASGKRARSSRQKSTASSSESSNSRSKGRGHGSKPSSRRTSCTIVDPSRPARQYRIKTSQTVPTATSQDIDDVLALHFRSCSLFTNPSYQSNSVLPTPTLSQPDARGFSGATSRFSYDEIDVAEKSVMPKHGEESIAVVEKTNTTMHWTSPGTRQREYERIDKANSGFRGFFRKVVPRSVSGPQEKFYEKDQSDTGSVRRYRMDDMDDELSEKDIPRLQSCAWDKSAIQPSMTKKRWICF